jgi:hypothetical protein
MIKPGKVCSQPMKENYTGETDINVVEKYFLHALVLWFKNSSKFMLELFHSSENIFNFQN